MSRGNSFYRLSIVLIKGKRRKDKSRYAENILTSSSTRRILNYPTRTYLLFAIRLFLAVAHSRREIGYRDPLFEQRNNLTRLDNTP